MKKLLSAAIATALVAGLTVPAFAATEIESPSKNNGAGDYSIGVNGKYTDGTAADALVSVDIEWGAMNFTYKAGSSSYDAGTHTTTTTAGTWSDNKPAITVTNHSNVAVDATMSFAATAEGVTGSFYTRDGENYTKTTDMAIKLGSGENTENAAEFTPPTGSLCFGIDSTSVAISENTTLGTITVNIAKAATVVATEQALKEALEAIKTTGGTIKLENDITIATGKYFEINGGTEDSPIVLNLNGHTLTGLLVSGRDLTNNQVVTANVVIQNGTLECTSDSQNIEYAVVMSWGDVRIKDVTVNATNYIVAGATSGGKIEVVDSTLNGGIVSEGITCTCMSLGGEFIFSGTVTMAGVMGVADVDPNNAKVTLKANGTYTLSGGTFEVTTDTDYTVSDCGSAYWLYELT